MLRRINKLFSIPKGFGKYYPKGGAGGGKGGGAGGSKKTNSSKAGPGGGGGGGDPNFNMPEGGPMRSLLWGAAAFGSWMLLSKDMGGESGREISWQDFQSELLESGLVDRIVVTNKNVAKITLRNLGGPGQDMSGAVDPNNAGSTARQGLLDKLQEGGSSDGANISSGMMNSGSSFEAGLSQNTGGTDGPSGVSAGLSALGGGQDTSSTTPSKYQRYPRLGNPASSNLTSTTNSPYHFTIGSVESFEKKLEDSQRALGIEAKDFIPVVYVQETSITSELARFAPTILLVGAYFFLMRGGGGMGGGGGSSIFQVGKSKAKRVNKELVTTTFADVAGCDDAKREIMEFVDFLKEPTRFTDLGAKIPRGALLCGPPGTGKTLLAKATAGEANVPFFSVSGSDFVEMFVGVGPSRVRDLFKEARANAPCIVFIDEIDAVGKQRGKGGMAGGGNDERENTLNQLLVEMDGFDTTSNIVLLAGTNRVDILDSALTRAGRFDRQITVDKPDLKGRKEIFEVHLKELNLSHPIPDYSSRLAALTPGMVGADIASLCNEAAIQAARASAKTITLNHFELATDRIIGGLESNKIMSPEERRVVAYHEAGHAVAGWNLKYADPLLKVTIVPRGNGALGYAQYLPKEIFLRTREQILDIVCMALAGRAAEQVNFGNVTTGAADDLRRVTQMVYQMVQVYGMNDKIGQISFPREEGQWPQDRLYSNATAEVMDSEVRAIVEEAYKRTIDLITDKQDQVTLVAELLLEKETITNIDVPSLIGERPHSAGAEYEEYANAGWKKSVGETIEGVVNEVKESVTPATEDEKDPLTPAFTSKSF